ncbi:hypothetical protein [Butyricicoccus sp. OF10-2]|uniref:hypothetical protein n=1 Tax=Butyricicoccus sp. OF10-2 TaxID=2292298 RepID=UPI001FAB0497|nr:hypothetical protein [Butyricicoccus sp. OF10-2]
MFAQGITTFLNSMSQFVSLPILFTVLGALIFRKAPKYAPKVITAVHVIAYGAFMIIKPVTPPRVSQFIICTPSLCCSSLNLPSCGI